MASHWPFYQNKQSIDELAFFTLNFLFFLDWLMLFPYACVRLKPVDHVISGIEKIYIPCCGYLSASDALKFVGKYSSNARSLRVDIGE